VAGLCVTVICGREMLAFLLGPGLGDRVLAFGSIGPWILGLAMEDGWGSRDPGFDCASAVVVDDIDLAPIRRGDC
jgi:hypothetical protein